MFRLKMISNSFGIDDHSPLYSTLEQARAAAHIMLKMYRGRVRVDIYQITDMRTHQKRVVESIGSQS